MRHQVADKKQAEEACVPALIEECSLCRIVLAVGDEFDGILCRSCRRRMGLDRPEE